MEPASWEDSQTELLRRLADTFERHGGAVDKERFVVFALPRPFGIWTSKRCHSNDILRRHIPEPDQSRADHFLNTAQGFPHSRIGDTQFDDAVPVPASRASEGVFKISIRYIQGPSVFDDEGIMVVNFPAERLDLCLGLARADDQGDRVLAK